MSLVIGIDPGENTGIALIQDGALVGLGTATPTDLADFLAAHRPSRVVYEDSRLMSRVWVPAAGAGSRAQAMSIARDIGRVDARCADLVAICARLGIPAHGISPKGKGAKLNAAQFAELTGYTGRSNQHQRDAAAVAWPYRNARKD